MQLNRTVARCIAERHLHAADNNGGVEVDSSLYRPRLFKNKATFKSIRGILVVV